MQFRVLQATVGSSHSSAVRMRTVGKTTFAACAAMLLAMVLVAAAAQSQKSPTNDEPYHLASAQAALRWGDFRVDPEDPPLWKYLAALPGLSVPFSADRTSQDWQTLTRDIGGGRSWALIQLYQTASNDPEQLFVRARVMLLCGAAALGAMIAAWSFALAGRPAAIVATAIFCCCPTLIGHAPAVKSDVPFSLAMLGLTGSLAAMLRRPTWARTMTVGLVVGLGLLTKFSAVLFPLPIAAASIWHSFAGSGDGETRLPARRIAGLIGQALLIGAVAYLTLWAGYLFRFSAASDGVPPLEINRVLATILQHERLKDDPAAGPPTLRDFNTWSPPVQVGVMRFAYEHRLLPEAFIVGELFVDASTYSWPHYFCGQVLQRGHWYYFPVVVLVKTPCAMLICWIVLAGWGVRHARLRKPRADVIAVMSVAGAYGLALLTANINEGARHVLPLLAFVCIGSGMIAARCWPQRRARQAIVALLILAAIETLAGYPNYIAYFNGAAGGPRGGIRWLGDSNLDWGQDLPALAAWQRQHPTETLYLAYSGSADPSRYGIRAITLPDGSNPPPSDGTAGPGVFAISASFLQGIYHTPQFDPGQIYASFRARPPRDVLGGTIYLFDWPGGPMPR